jgi:hypothetical protein
MGVHILFDPEYYMRLGGGAVLVDSVSGTAFGPVMSGWKTPGTNLPSFDARQMALGFLQSFAEDARTLEDHELDRRWTEFSQSESLAACPGLCDETPLKPPRTVCDEAKCRRYAESVAEEKAEEGAAR